MVTQWFSLSQDALNKEYTLKQLSQERVAEILKEGHSALQQHTGHSHGKISLTHIEGVAKARFALSVITEIFHNHVDMGITLLRAVREVCTDTTVNHVDGTGQTDSTGPVLYLLKLIVRQYGLSCLTEVCAAHTWVMPLGLRKADKVLMTGCMKPNFNTRLDHTPWCFWKFIASLSLLNGSLLHP